MILDYSPRALWRRFVALYVRDFLIAVVFFTAGFALNLLL